MRLALLLTLALAGCGPRLVINCPNERVSLHDPIPMNGLKIQVCDTKNPQECHDVGEGL